MNIATLKSYPRPLRRQTTSRAVLDLPIPFLPAPDARKPFPPHIAAAFASMNAPTLPANRHDDNDDDDWFDEEEEDDLPAAPQKRRTFINWRPDTAEVFAAWQEVFADQPGPHSQQTYSEYLLDYWRRVREVYDDAEFYKRIEHNGISPLSFESYPGN